MTIRTLTLLALFIPASASADGEAMVSSHVAGERFVITDYYATSGAHGPEGSYEVGKLRKAELEECLDKLEAADGEARLSHILDCT